MEERTNVNVSGGSNQLANHVNNQNQYFIGDQFADRVLPAQTQQHAQRQRTNVKAEHDETTIRHLMRHMDVPLMDEYFGRGPARVKSKIFEMHDAWNGIISSSTFIIYNRKMSALVNDFFDTWHKMVLDSVVYYEDSKNPGDVVFGQAEFDFFRNQQEEHDFYKLMYCWSTLHAKFTAMIDCIKHKYVIDWDDVVIK
jgi:hypothetical protein